MNEDKRKTDYFGFLPYKWTIEFNGGKASTVPRFGDTPIEIFYGKP